MEFIFYNEEWNNTNGDIQQISGNKTRFSK